MIDYIQSPLDTYLYFYLQNDQNIHNLIRLINKKLQQQKRNYDAFEEDEEEEDAPRYDGKFRF